MRSLRTVLKSFVWCVLIWSVATVAVLAAEKTVSGEKRSAAPRATRGGGLYRGGGGSGYRRGSGRGFGWSGGRGYGYGRVLEEKPFTFCPPPCK